MKGNIKLHVRPKDRLVKDVLILNYCSGWNRLDRSIIGKVYADCDRFRQSAGLFLYQKMIYGLAGTGLDDTGRQTEMKSGNHGFAPGYNLQSTESLNTGDSSSNLSTRAGTSCLTSIQLAGTNCGVASRSFVPAGV